MHEWRMACDLLALRAQHSKCLNVQERPISQKILIIDIFSYKTAKFGECRSHY